MTDSKYRTYTHTIGGKQKILVWSQRRCEKCQRFIGKLRRRFCVDCQRKESLKEYNCSDKRKICSKKYKAKLKALGIRYW